VTTQAKGGKRLATESNTNRRSNGDSNKSFDTPLGGFINKVVNTAATLNRSAVARTSRWYTRGVVIRSTVGRCVVVVTTSRRFERKTFSKSFSVGKIAEAEFVGVNRRNCGNDSGKNSKESGELHYV